MKRTLFYAAVILSTSTFLIQCVATQQDVEYTNVKVRQMDTKVAGMDKEIDSLKKQTMESAQAREAATGERLEYQQSEIMRLQGEIEENNFLSRQIREENRELKQLLLNRLAASDSKRDEDINRLAERLALIDEQLRKAAERVNMAENEIKGIKEARSQEAAQRAMEAARKAREAERKARLAAEEEAQRKKTRTLTPDALKVDVSSQNITAISADEVEAVEPPVAEEKAPKAEPPQAATVKAEPAPAAVKSAAPAPPEPPPAPPVSGKLAEAMVFFKEKKYRDAYNGFAEYLEKNPSGSEAVEARYYAGESLFEDKDYELAILEFQKVIVEHSRHALAPKALYRQGLSFERINDTETARIIYNKLVDSYPEGEEVKAAKARLEELK